MSLWDLLWIIPVSSLIAAGMLFGLVVLIDCHEYKRTHGNRREEEF